MEKIREYIAKCYGTDKGNVRHTGNTYNVTCPDSNTTETAYEFAVHWFTPEGWENVEHCTCSMYDAEHGLEPCLS